MSVNVNMRPCLRENREKIGLKTSEISIILLHFKVEYIHILLIQYAQHNTGLFISPSGISELDCATTKTDTAERNISRGREYLQVFFVLGALAYFQVPPLGGSSEEK